MDEFIIRKVLDTFHGTNMKSDIWEWNFTSIAKIIKAYIGPSM